MMVEERRQELYRYLFELSFFWNEAGGAEETQRALTHWIDSGLLEEQSGAATLHSAFLKSRHTAIPQAEGPTAAAATDSVSARREQVRQWLASVDPVRYRDMQSRYLAPQQTVMVPIEGGEFMMGDETGDLGDASRPMHPVQLDSFWLANVPVTWWHYGLYLFASRQEQQLESKAETWGLNGNHPAYNVDWYEAADYCNWLSEQMGLATAYAIDRDQADPNNLNEDDEKKWTVRLVEDANGFCLPTEAQWEYACRAGTTTKYSFGDSEDELAEHGWFEGNSDRQSQPVSAKKPNAWGLYDMHGNVLEWCQDWFGQKYYASSQQLNPLGPDKGRYRVVRGGSWSFAANGCRSACRDWLPAGASIRIFGFRVCLVRRSDK